MGTIGRVIRLPWLRCMEVASVTTAIGRRCPSFPLTHAGNWMEQDPETGNIVSGIDDGGMKATAWDRTT